LISRSVRDILGYTQEDLVGTNFADLAHADDLAAAAGALAAATRGEDPLIAQAHVVAKSGAVRMLEGKVSALFDPAGNPTFLVTNSRDVTERISLEEQLRQSQKMEAIGKLAGGVAHDFNNLLTAINGYSDMALESLPPEEDDLRHSLEEIRRAGERAAELTRQLLAFSRQQVLRPEPVELSAIIEGYLAIFERLVGEDITVHAKLDPKLPTVHGDPGAARAGPAESRRQRPRRHAGRWRAADRDCDRRDRCRERCRGSAGPVRHAHGERHRPRNGRS